MIDRVEWTAPADRRDKAAWDEYAAWLTRLRFARGKPWRYEARAHPLTGEYAVYSWRDDAHNPWDFVTR